MIVRKEIDFNEPLTEEQKKMLEKSAAMSIVFNDDSPELTAEELMEFRKIADIKKEERRKQTITLRLSPSAIRKAKSLGKGYTSILSRILENALNDKDIIRKSL